jgi:hypothetical protein
MVGNMVEVAIVRKVKDVILERTNDLPAIKTNGESRGLKA